MTTVDRRGSGGWDDLLQTERYEARPGAEWCSELWRVAAARFERAADVVGLEDDLRARLLEPRRALVMNLPVRLDDGTVRSFTGYRAQHTLAMGQTKGGLRLAPGVSLGECAALAMGATLTCALVELECGGATGGVRCDPHRLSDGELERLIRRYASELHAILGEDSDIPAPDMAIGERELAWFREATGAEPVSLDSSRGRRDAGGLGAVYTLEAALEYLRVPLEGLRVVVQGFGDVGAVIARELVARGALLVGVSDVTGGVVSQGGLDLDALELHRSEHRFLRGYNGEGSAVTRTEILEAPCDVLVPAALEQQITDRNAHRIAAGIVLEAAGCATTLEADATLAARGVRLVPDVLAAAGGMIVSYFTWVQDQQKFTWDQTDVAQRLREQLRGAFADVIAAAERLGVDWRTAAHAIALRRVADSARLRSGV